jgi:plastocyanin
MIFKMPVKAIPESRREFLRQAGRAVVGFAVLGDTRWPNAPVVETIEMRSDPIGSEVWFDPIGLYVEPGTTVRWIVRENVHTTTAFHPRNDKHSLRIPERAATWDSGFLIRPGSHFQIIVTEPGVYDYYCAPHEATGMVGRIVVGRSGVTRARAYDYWVGKPGTSGWRRVPDAARRAFPSVSRILAEGRVRRASG